MKVAKDAIVKPIYLYPTDSYETIISKLKKEQINACIVVTKEKKFLGEISVEDIIKIFLHQLKYEDMVKILDVGYSRDIQYLQAKDLINKHRATVKEYDPIKKVIKLIYKEGFHYIPVVNESKKVIGVITPSSLINFLQDK